MEVSKRIQKGYIVLNLFGKVKLTTAFQNLTAGHCSHPLCRIKEIPELFIIGRPDMTIVAFGSDAVDIFEVNDILSSKGWHLNALQRPNR